MELAIGTRYRGFVVRRASAVDLMSSSALEFEHEATGLRLLHVSNDDVENLFSINFPTPPPDDTGIPHILEHCVLAGSRKAISMAVRNNKVAQRFTALEWRLGSR